MEIISKKSHSYAGKERKPGEKYNARADHARFLISQGFAAPALQAEMLKISTPKPTYKTAAVQAEDAPVAPVKAEDLKKTYKRRDLTATE